MSSATPRSLLDALDGQWEDRLHRRSAAFAAAPEFQAGDWYVDRNAAWVEGFIEQITVFPNAAHDDMCDMMSQASAWLLQANAITVSIVNAFTGLPID